MDSGFQRRLNSSERRRPPDYTSRGTRLRLFLWAAAVMLGLSVVDAAREGRLWQWLTMLERAPVEPFRNRLEDSGWRTAGDPPGTFVAAADVRTVNDDALLPGEVKAVERAWMSGWRHVYGGLSSDERSLLVEMMDTAPGRALPAEKTARAAELVQRLEGLWQEHQTSALPGLAELNEADRATWTGVLQQADERFRDHVLVAMQAIYLEGTRPENRDEVMESARAAVVALARGEVRDDTVVFRPAEQPIWVHELTRLSDLGAEELSQATAVSYLQLHKQPADYRGKLVRVKGTVRSAYRSPAAAGAPGITEYVVYVILPEGGPDSPLLVYALGAPPGFPALSNAGQAPARPGLIREPVEVSGIFFKRCAYAAPGGVFTAPLILADVPVWRPAPPIEAARWRFTAMEFGAMALAALMLAACLTAVLWKRTSGRFAANRQEREFVNLGPLEIGPTTAEQLREMERRAKSESQA